MNRILTLLISFYYLFMLTSCVCSKYSNKTTASSFTVEERKYQTRAWTDELITIASSGIKSLVDLNAEKYKASYSNSLQNTHFYDSLSTVGPNDPTGCHFYGFTILRTFINKMGRKDTALFATFETDSPEVILNNSTFRLKLKDIIVNYALAKIPSTKWYLPWTLIQKNMNDKLNLEFVISLKSSYVTKSGENSFEPVTEKEFGTFNLILKDIPLNPDTSRNNYFQNLKGQVLDGAGFLLTRSHGYINVDTTDLQECYYIKRKKSQECYNRGLFNVLVTVNESGHNKFINTTLQENSSEIVKGVSETPVNASTKNKKK